jgi:hypothetical protein
MMTMQDEAMRKIQQDRNEISKKICIDAKE